MRFLYLRAIKNIAAPYAAAPPIAAIAMPVLVPPTFAEVESWLLVLNTPPPVDPEAEVDAAALELPVPVAPLFKVAPGVRGMAELM